MTKVFLALLAIVFFNVQVNAATFECVFGKQTFAHSNTGRKEKRANRYDPDPVYKIVVEAWTEDNTTHKMLITHVTKSGEQHERGEQYPINVVLRRGDNFYWSGYYVDIRGDLHPNVEMLGALEQRRGNWIYTESRYDNNKLAWRNVTTCIPQDTE